MHLLEIISDPIVLKAEDFIRKSKSTYLVLDAIVAREELQRKEEIE